jgi:hypothetical protein
MIGFMVIITVAILALGDNGLTKDYYIGIKLIWDLEIRKASFKFSDLTF